MKEKEIVATKSAVCAISSATVNCAINTCHSQWGMQNYSRTCALLKHAATAFLLTLQSKVITTRNTSFRIHVLPTHRMLFVSYDFHYTQRYNPKQYQPRQCV
jgi:hypothetical protein